MNVFVLTVGRTGSYTFYQACKHITNYSSGHETLIQAIGSDRFDYPTHHIEVDNRLSWTLGRLDQAYGDDALYVHLIRDVDAVAESHFKRWNNQGAIVRAYTNGILCRPEIDLSVVRDMIHTVDSNIMLFLKDKSKKITVDIRKPLQSFQDFWSLIGAEGDLEESLKTLSQKSNVSQDSHEISWDKRVRRFLHKKK